MLEWFIKIPSFLNSLFSLWKRIKNICEKDDPVETLEYREKLKREFENKLPPKPNRGGDHCRCEAIIRDITRMDEYPDIDPKSKGISPWFKVEVKGLYHKGLEIFWFYSTGIYLG